MKDAIAILLLHGRHQQVVATDGNEEQLKHAKAAQNVIYRYSDAHSIDLPDSCADLVTAASALHWFELSRFYKECRRVLKPHGCLAAWAIPLVRLSSVEGLAGSWNDRHEGFIQN